MESGTLGMDASAAPDPRVHSDCNIAYLRRRAWAQSRDSIWQEAEPEDCGPQEPQRTQKDEEAQRPSEETGRDPNEIANWLSECRTPLGASLDDQSSSPHRGALRNGCSFEDDLSLGAEANHLRSSNNKTESCFGLAADQKRSRFKEGGRSMNSTGSGKSSTVSSVSKVVELSEEQPEAIVLNLRVSELLDLYEEDPEEILLNLGFGREEPDPASRVPSRFINNASSARGIDIKVYLGAQLQRMELENPNYALTSRFRQIEVLTTVANEFFQLYSQVSGQPVQRISRDQGGEGEEGGDEPSPPLKRNSSALNAAKLLKKTISKHNLLAAASESPEAHKPKQNTELNGHAPFVHTNTNGHAHTGPEQNGCSTDPDHQGETVNQKHNRKKDSCSLATVTEETNGDGETDDSPEQSSTGTATAEEHQPESSGLKSANQRADEGTQEIKEVEEEEKNLTSTPEKAPFGLVPLQLSQLRNKNTDSFDMEEIQSNEDEALPHRSSRTTDLFRTVSQQSDSSGFAEEPSADSNSFLKVQESSDSCDSETTVTSHPSQDVATPLALDQPAFDLPDSTVKEAGPDGAAEVHGKINSMEEEEHNQSSEQVPQYTGHQLPINGPMEMQQEEEQIESGIRTDGQSVAENSQSISVAEQEPQPEVEHTRNHPALKQGPEQTQSQTEITTDIKPPTNGEDAEDEAQEEHTFLNDSDSLYPPASSCLVLSALKRAEKNQLSRARQGVNPKPSDAPQRGRGRGKGGISLQRSSSLPSSFLSPSRVVSSVRIQFGRGQASCTKPRYSFRFTNETGGEKEEEEEKEKDGKTNCLSTLIINPASSSGSNSRLRVATDTSFRPKPIPRHLMRSSCSLQSSSPPPDWSSGAHAQSWSTQSVPDLSSVQQHPGQFQQNMSTNQNQQSCNPGQGMFPYPNTTAQYSNPSPAPSLNYNPYPFSLNPPLQYPSSLQPYASLPNLLNYNNPSFSHHSSLTNFHQSIAPAIPQHNSLFNLHQPSASTAPHHVGHLHSGTPVMHPQGYNSAYSHQSPCHSTPHIPQCASPYLGFHGYHMNPNLGFPSPANQYPSLVPEHSLQQGITPPGVGFLPGLARTLSPGPNPNLGLTPPALSSTEMQLRKVLHDIRGTVHSISQNSADNLNPFSEHKAALASQQSLIEFQQKRQSLNLFRHQMMDLELSIIQQQALVYKHLSPTERLEVEQLQSLRSAVRGELQELEQQLEDRLMDLTHQTKYRGLHRDSSIDSLSADSALRAIEPVSDLLREQLFLQSEITYGGRTPSTRYSSRSSSPGRREGRDGEQGRGMYRASINITPAPPQRPKTHTEEEEGEGDGGGGKTPEVEGAVGGVGVENLQQLISQIRESVAQEVRREIYNELLATMSPQQSPLPSRQRPL